MPTKERINARVLNKIMQLYEDDTEDILLLLNATSSMENNSFWNQLCSQYQYNNDEILRNMCESQLELRSEDIARAKRIFLVKRESRLLAMVEQLLRREITIEEVVQAICRIAESFLAAAIASPNEAYQDAIADFGITQSATQEELRAAYLRKRLEIGGQRAVADHEVIEQLARIETQLIIILTKRGGALLPQITNNDNDNQIEAPKTDIQTQDQLAYSSKSTIFSNLRASGGIASPTGEKADQSLFQELGFENLNNSNEHTQEKPSSSGNIKFADDDDSDMSLIEIPGKQENELIEQPFVVIEPYFGPPGAQLKQQHYGRNEDTSPPRGSAAILDAANLASAGQQKERNLQNWSKKQLGSRTLFSNSDEVHDANDQEGSREQSEFAHVQQRSTSCASDSLETDYSLVPKSVEIQPAVNVGESFDKTSEKEAQGVQLENKEERAQSNRNEKTEDKNCNSVQMKNSTKQSSVLEQGSDQKNQDKPKTMSTDPAVTSKGAEENNISHESENKKENKQINTQSKNTEKEKKFSPNPTHSAGNSANNGQRRPSSYSNKLTERVAGTPGKTRPAQSCSTGRFEENAQKSPRALAIANSKRPPFQPFPRIAKKKTEISDYSPSINLTNQEGIAAYNLILVGDSTVGKTTLFNSSANYLLFESEAEAFGNPMFLSDVSFRVIENSRPELISVQANFKSEDGLGINNSQYPFMEEITYYDPESGKMKMLRILDTPGINDEKDTLNVENILKAAKLMGEIHGIGILIGPNEVRMKMNFTLALNRLLGQFHKSAIKNLLFFYTKVSGPIYAPGDGYPLVKTYLKTAKIDLPLDLENVFCFDNGWFRSLCIKQFNSKNGKMYEVPTRTGWSHSKNEMERLMKRLSKSKEPYKMEESVFLDETKRFLEDLAEPVSQCLLKYIEKSYEIEGIAKDRDQPQLMVNGVKEEAELKKTFDKILKKCSQLGAFLQKNTIVPSNDPFLKHFTSLRDIEKEKDEQNQVKSHHLPKLRSACENYVAELNNAIYDVKKPNIEEIKNELVGMPHFKAIFFNAFGGKMKF